MEEDYDEDEMLRVAEELSLLAKKQETLWTTDDTETTESSVQLLDQIIEAQFNNTTNDPDEGCSLGLVAMEKLRYYQEKIVRTIQSIPEDDTLAILLELNDSVSTVLSKTSMVPKLRDGGLEPPNNASSDSSRTMTSCYDDYNNNNSGSPRSSAVVDDYRNPPVASFVYMLRRGTKNEISTAVRQLSLMCPGINNTEKGMIHSGGSGGSSSTTSSTSVLMEMRAAGTLQALLSALARCITNDWTDVELQISKLISILVTYEEDWQLVQRMAFEILSALYTLQLRSSARTRSVSSAPAFLSGVMNASGGGIAPFSPNASGKNLAMNTAEDCGSGNRSTADDEMILQQQQQQQQQQQMLSDVRALVAAALAKVGLLAVSGPLTHHPLIHNLSPNPHNLKAHTQHTNPHSPSIYLSMHRPPGDPVSVFGMGQGGGSPRGDRVRPTRPFLLSRSKQRDEQCVDRRWGWSYS